MVDHFPRSVRESNEVEFSAGTIGDFSRSVYILGVRVPGSVSHYAYARLFFDHYYMDSRGGYRDRIYRLGIALPSGHKVVSTGFVYDYSSGRYMIQITDWEI